LKQLGGEAIFPAAAYIAMAIEAITQINESLEKPTLIENYAMRDVKISSPIIIPDNDDGVETLYSFRPCPQHGSQSSLWYCFSVSSLSDDVWKVHATGAIGMNSRKGLRNWSSFVYTILKLHTQDATPKRFRRFLSKLPTVPGMTDCVRWGLTSGSHSEIPPASMQMARLITLGPTSLSRKNADS
jgi:hypothetical protein